MTGFMDDLPELGTPGTRSRRPGPRSNPDFVPFVRVRCPTCNSAQCRVYDSNHIPIRYHRCRACGNTFKSVEVNYRCAEHQ